MFRIVLKVPLLLIIVLIKIIALTSEDNGLEPCDDDSQDEDYEPPEKQSTSRAITFEQKKAAVDFWRS